MIQESVIPIEFGRGTDTKTDPKAVVAGKFLRLENGVFTSPQRITKRNGYTKLNPRKAGGGNITSPKLAHGYKDEATCEDGGVFYSFSQSQDAWIERGRYVSTELSRIPVDQERANSGYCDCAILGNYTLYAWSTAGQATIGGQTSKIYASVIDNVTDTVLVGPTLIFNTSNTSPGIVKCVLLGGTTLALVYSDPNTPQLLLKTVVFSGGGSVSFGSPQTVTTNQSLLYFNFDIEATATGAAIAYFSTTGVTVSLIDATGAVTSTSNTIDAAAFLPIALSVNAANGTIWVYWTDTTFVGPPTAANVVYKVYSSALAVVLAKTTLATLSAPFEATNIISISQSATQQLIYIGILAETFPLEALYTDQTIALTATSAGVVGPPLNFCYGVAPYSKPFTVGSKKYAVFIYRQFGFAAPVAGGGGVLFGAQQPTYFVCDLNPIATGLVSPLAVARFGSGVAGSQATLSQIISFIPNVFLLNGVDFIFACGIETQEFNSDFNLSTENFPGGLVGIFSYSIDFNGASSYVAKNSGELAILNGGVVQAYDGQNVNELNFHLFPEISKVDAVTSTGSIGAGTYSYIAIFQWTDAHGNLHQSAPSLPVSVAVVGPDNTVNVTVSGCFLTQKINATVSVYRTQNAGSVYFLINDPVFLISVSGIVGGQILDVYSDAQIAGNPQAYTYPASSVLENGAPPPAMSLLAHNNRLWLVNSENKNEVWYTKSFQPDVGVSPSPFMIEQLDPKYGDIVATAEMDEKIVFLKENGIFAQSGDGVNDTGNGSTLSFPQIVPTDVGCSEMKSVVLTPNGVMFKSINGVYILDRSLNTSYIGAEVEAYNSQTITSASLIPSKSQIRFLCSTGLTLVYDYLFGQWGTFTNHTGVSSSTWNNSYIYSTGSAIYKEAPGYYLDDTVPFSLLLQFSWLALATIQGFQRVRRLIALGDFVNGASASHGVSIAAAYDFSTTFQPAISYFPGAAAAQGVFQYRERLPIQKCDSITLLVQELVTGDSAEYLDLTNMSFEAGVKKGVNKLGGLQTVG